MNQIKDFEKFDDMLVHVKQHANTTGVGPKDYDRKLLAVEELTE